MAQNERSPEEQKRVKRLFGNIRMGWLSVILFAVCTGIYTGSVMLIPFLRDTSFQDIGINYEWWVVFAVVIVTNCEKNWDAMLKCFVFFLISQPLVYLTEVCFGPMTLERAMLYYRQMWLPMTFLTLPGGFAAYYCRKQNATGSVVLGLGNTLQLLLGVMYAFRAAADFPHHLLSAAFCFASVWVMTVQIQRQKKYRLLTILFAVGLTVITLLLLKTTGRYLVSDVNCLSFP